VPSAEVQPRQSFPSTVDSASGSVAVPEETTEQTRWFIDEVHPHDGQLRAYLRGAFPAVRDVNDVVQESYLRIWRARAAHPIDSARGFLFTIARRLALKRVVKERFEEATRGANGEALVIADAALCPAATLSYREKVELLAAALRHLPPRCREIVIRRKLLGHSQREVAAQLGLSERTVENQVARGVQLCETWLRKRGVESAFDR
jgi:RNA polymerase sigma factor (sigma-70 family)